MASRYAQTPFTVIQPDLQNRMGDADVSRSIDAANVPLDFGDVPVGQFKTLGTGGLMDVDSAPGSYMWIAVADPVTRRGVTATVHSSVDSLARVTVQSPVGRSMRWEIHFAP